MPKSKKRKVENTSKESERHYNVQESKAGKILIIVLVIAMVLGIAFAAVYLMISAL